MSNRRPHKRIKRDRSIIKIEGATEESLLAKNRSLNKAKDVRRHTNSFLSRHERPVFGPIVSSTYVPPKIREELNILGYDISISKKGMRTIIIRMPKDHISKEELAANGIVVAKQTNTETMEEYWFISMFDMLHLLKETHQDHKLHNELTKWMNSQNPNFLEDYIVYRELHKYGLIVMDSTQWMGNMAIIEEPSPEYQAALMELDKKDVGIGRSASTHGIGIVHVIRQDYPTNLDTIISGVHTTDKEDTRYYVATVEGIRDDQNHLIIQTGDVQFYEIRHDRLNKATSPGRKALIMYPAPLEE